MNSKNSGHARNLWIESRANVSVSPLRLIEPVVADRAMQLVNRVLWRQPDVWMLSHDAIGDSEPMSSLAIAKLIIQEHCERCRRDNECLVGASAPRPTFKLDERVDAFLGMAGLVQDDGASAKRCECGRIRAGGHMRSQLPRCSEATFRITKCEMIR